MSEKKENIIVRICNLIAGFMELDQEHCYIYNQKWFVPKDKGLCVTVGILDTQVYYNGNSHYDDERGNYRNLITIQKRDNIEVNVFSYDLSAYDRKEEVIMALNTDIARNDQTINSYHLENIPTSFTNINEPDGDKILYRYTINFGVISQTSKTAPANYYDYSSMIIKQINN